jgi:AcrR family transcriptional regulator
MKQLASTLRGRQAASEDRRQRILDAARTCLAEHGADGATVEAIAGRAGVSNGLLYQFFQNKEHLLEVVLEGAIRDWVRALAADSRTDSAARTLDGMLRRSVAFCRSHPLLPALLAGEGGLARIGRIGHGRVAAHRELVASILERGIATGEFRLDLDVPATADVICQLQAHYSARAYRRDPDYPDSPAVIEAVSEFIRNAVSA